MAWTTPMTFTANTPLTAAQLNTHLRDNLLETMTGKAFTAGQFFVSGGVHQIVPRDAVRARVDVNESTDSHDDWADLATPGPAVTVQTGTKAMVFCYAKVGNTTAETNSACSWEISGATTRAPLWQTAVEVSGISTRSMRWSSSDVITNLVPGENTFTMKYRCGSGTASFDDRFIGVLPF